MAKKRTRHQNPEPFLPANETASTASRKRNKQSKRHQEEDKLISKGMSSKILREALIQQKEVQEEGEGQNPSGLVFAEETAKRADPEDNDIDEFDGFDETQCQFGNYEEEIDEEDEKLLEAFISKDAGPQRTLADLIVTKIKEKHVEAFSGVPKLDDSVIDVYKGVAKILNKYTVGKMPKAFKSIPSLGHWEEVLYLTEPEKWSPNAMYQATRMFASNMPSRKVERFYKLVVLPRVREDIRKNKRLHFALYQTLMKALFKPAAFNKGILFPLCESGTCNLREAVIIGSILQKGSMEAGHGSVALLILAQMEYCGTTSYFIKILLEKKYSLAYKVLDAMISHFLKFAEEERVMPVIWHQSLLAFVQRYKNDLKEEDVTNLKKLVQNQKHRLVTPEILRELNNRLKRGEKGDDLMDIAPPVSIVNKTIQEDRFNTPDVPMEAD